uniref:F-box associated beta-propeller type 3 domain-containing protein n=4 Tax=Triticinae TaxID=1648030 RepID=A0A453QLF3_AEGTS
LTSLINIVVPTSPADIMGKAVSHRPSSSAAAEKTPPSPSFPLICLLPREAFFQPRFQPWRDRPVQRRRRRKSATRGAISMADSSGTTVFDNLPEWLVVDEILVRLPPKDILRCRAVRKSWLSGTSTNTFILDHHRRQPSLPIIKHHKGICRLTGASNERKIRPVLQYARHFSSNNVTLHAACDGFLIMSQQRSDFRICNPATRKCASLPHPPSRPGSRFVDVVGFYQHTTSGEHRVLWVSVPIPVIRAIRATGPQGADMAIELPDYFVLTVGSDQPRCIQWPTISKQEFPDIRSSRNPPVHHRGSLHWEMGINITVFDTIAETFRRMSCPARLENTHMWSPDSLSDMGGALALCRSAPDCLTFDIWVLQDYDAETWGFQYQINLLAMEVSPPIDLGIMLIPMTTLINEHELLIQQCPSRLLHCEIDGVSLRDVESGEHEYHLLPLTTHRLQESMISLPLFEAQEEDAVNKEAPFVIVL